jgi:hypothetical protein
MVHICTLSDFFYLSLFSQRQIKMNGDSNRSQSEAGPALVTGLL